MGVATSTLIIGGIAAAAGGAKAISGAKQKRDARNAINAYDRQDLDNPANDMRISTLGSEIQREQNSQMQANTINAIQMGGSRAIIGATGKAAAESNNMAQNIGLNLDNQMIARERMIVQGEGRIQTMQEQREIQDLNGLGADYAAGQQNTWSGIDQIASAGMMMAGNADFGTGTGGNKTPTVQKAETSGMYGIAASPYKLKSPYTQTQTQNIVKTNPIDGLQYDMYPNS